MSEEKKRVAIVSNLSVWAPGVVAPASMERPKDESLDGFVEFMRSQKDIPKTKEEIIANARRDGVEERVIQAFAEIPREEFIHPRLREFSYFDFPIPVVYLSPLDYNPFAYGRSVPKPSYIMRILTQLDTRPSHSVLQLPTGSGYTAALLSRLTTLVNTHDSNYGMFKEASQNFGRLGLNNIHWCPGSPLIVENFLTRFLRGYKFKTILLTDT